ncbi:MAG: hypothetical protein HY363_02445 [Candidatus Aenigmarchaeota archaeon]|nr:hypothetical protein [Candidatus Aenigmarchaeota archaeon]
MIILLIFVGVLLSFPVFSQETSETFQSNIAELRPVVFYQTVKSCEPASFAVKVRNQFDESDTYDFFVDGFENDSVITPKTAILDGGNAITVSINLTPPDCTLTGRVPVVFAAESRSDGSAVEIELVLDISAQDVPLIGSGVESIMTNYSKTAAAIPVINNAKEGEPLRFNVKLVGEPWMNAVQSSLQLSSGEEKSLNLVFEPPATVPEGKYNAAIVLTHPASKKEFKKNIVVQLQTLPFAKKIFLKATRTGSSVFLAVVLLISLMKFYFWHTSPEQKHARLVDAELRAQKREKRKEELIEKQKEKQKNTEAKQKNTEKSLRQKYYFVAKDSVVNASGTRSKWSLIFAVLIILGLTAGAVVFLRTFPDKTPFAGLGIALVTLLLFASKIIHARCVCKKLNLVVAGEEAVIDAWNKGFTQAGFVSKVPVKNLRMKIKKSRCGVPKLEEKVYSYATVSASVDADFVDVVNLHAKLPLHWAKNEDDIRVWRWSGAEWLEIIPDSHRKTSNAVELHVSADALGTFAVGVLAASSVKNRKHTAAKIKGVLVKKAKNTNTPGFLGYVGLALLFAVVIIVFTYFAPKNEINSAGIPRQTWAQDTDHSLNLSPYFNDPDGDQLKFSASSVDGITVNIIEDTVLFSPSAGFYGEREVVFTASDLRNSSVKSNKVKLVVTKSYLPVWARQYVINVVAGLGIILLLFVFRQWKGSLRKFLEG